MTQRTYKVTGERVTACITATVTVDEADVRQHYSIPADQPVTDSHWEEYVETEADADFEIDEVLDYGTKWKSEIAA